MNAVELALEHISHLNAAYGVSIPLVLVEPYDNLISIDPERQPNNVPLIRVRGSRLPRLNQNTLLPIPTSADSPKECWYTPGTGDVFDSLRRTGTLSWLLDEGKDHAFVSSCDDVGALCVYLPILLLLSQFQSGSTRAFSHTSALVNWTSSLKSRRRRAYRPTRSSLTATADFSSPNPHHKRRPSPAQRQSRQSRHLIQKIECNIDPRAHFGSTYGF
jgi:hypothetical protein